MATATQNDDSDLLILSDNNTLTDTIVLDDNIVNEELTTGSDELLSFDSNESNSPDISITENTLDLWSSDETLSLGSDLFITEDKTTEDKTITTEKKVDDDNSNGFDLWDFSTDSSEEKIIETEVETEELDLKPNEDLSTSLGLSSDNNLTISADSSIENNSEVFSLKVATETFVSQLEKAKEQNSNSIERDEGEISNRENQITSLKSEITDFNKSIKEKKSDNNEIDSKILLVTWNSKANNIKSTTSTKVHNVKRRKAA